MAKHLFLKTVDCCLRKEVSIESGEKKRMLLVRREMRTKITYLHKVMIDYVEPAIYAH